MQQADALEILKNNQLALSKDASQALIDIGKELDLPSAQFVKLAQVYNAWCTVSHFKNASDRATEPPGLVDPVELAELYSTDVTKRASQESNQPSPVGNYVPVNIMSMFRPSQASQVEKQASAPEVEEEHFTPEQVKEAAQNMRGEATYDAQRIARSLMQRDDLVDACHDARYAAEEDSVLKAAAYVVKFAMQNKASPPFVPTAADLPPKRNRSTEVRTEDSDALAKLAWLIEDIELADNVMAMLKEGAQIVPDEPEVDEETDKERESATSAADDAMQQLVDSGMSEAEMLEAGVAAHVVREVMSRRGGAEDEATGGASTGGSRGKEKSSEKPKAGKGEKSFGMGDVASLALSPISAAAAGINYGAERASGLLSSIASKDRQNTDQRNSDLNVEDIRRQILFRRMISTDPILREHDPSRLSSIYNTLAAANPAMARDMEALKLPLREAAAYEGVPIDSLKQLTDIRKSTADATSKEKEIEKNRYNSSDKGLTQVLTSL
jgi:hypothetical protein